MWGRNESLSFPQKQEQKWELGIISLLSHSLPRVSFFPSPFQRLKVQTPLLLPREVQRPGSAPGKDQRWAFDNHRRSGLTVVGPRKSSGLQKPNRTNVA